MTSRTKRSNLVSIAESAAPTLGIVEWFRPGEYEHVESVLADLKILGVEHLRTAISWADWYTDKGIEWYDWLLPLLAGEANLLPCVTYTPPSIGIVGKSSSPPKNPKDYADFIDVLITRYGAHFEWIELWNEPNNLNDWDWRLDPYWNRFSEMVGGAAYWAQHRGKKTVLAGACPTDPNWLDLLVQNGVLACINAVGIHGFPGTWEHDWSDWSHPIALVQEVLDRNKLDVELWITEAGYSTWRFDEHQQVKQFAQVIQAKVPRVYWYADRDLHSSLPHQDGYHKDERHYHMGLKRSDGKPKLLFRVWADKGFSGINHLAGIDVSAVSNRPKPPKKSRIKPLFKPQKDMKPILITGGAGFIGTNLAQRLLSMGESVLLYDNLSQPDADRNIKILRQQNGAAVQVKTADLRDLYSLSEAIRQSKQIYHLAGQISLHDSFLDPWEDFQINAQGTFHLLECIRSLETPPPLVFASSGQLYRKIGDAEIHRELTRYEPSHHTLKRNGISEEHPLELNNPFCCSKGLADQYVVNYAHAYGLATVVLRLGSVYGPHQHGSEDPGWIAQFLENTLDGHPIRIYGDGMQVQDILHVDDLVDALILSQESLSKLSGRIFNIGGGPAHTLSYLELGELVEELHGIQPTLHLLDWRENDRKYYVSDIRNFESATGWMPRIGVREGIESLYVRMTQEAGSYESPYLLQEEAIP